MRVIFEMPARRLLFAFAVRCCHEFDALPLLLMPLARDAVSPIRLPPYVSSAATAFRR